jgi:CheY-like chemotaxis protein
MNERLSALKVLIADDNVHLRTIVASILAGIGITKVRECSDGAQAIRCLKDWSPDIAIVDFRMKPIDGVEFTRHVRNAPDSPKPELPIIMLTGYADKSRVFEARDAGITELIVKPVTVRALLERINAVIYRPRHFVRTSRYYGPCRRRRQDPKFEGPFRRETDPNFKGQKSYSLGDT